MFVRDPLDTCWVEQTRRHEPGEIAQFMIEYRNTSSSRHRDVAFGVDLPDGFSLVPNTTVIINGTYPDGVAAESNNVASGGIDVGHYAPNSNAFVIFDVALPYERRMECGISIGVLRGVVEYVDRVARTDEASVVLTNLDC